MSLMEQARLAQERANREAVEPEPSGVPFLAPYLGAYEAMSDLLTLRQEYHAVTMEHARLVREKLALRLSKEG